MPYQEPEFLPWDGRRVPITFVAGYLGAGKTTAINALLEHADRPIAVLVNDVGEINIDAALIKRRHGDTIELTDGCVCCSLIDGFGAAFDRLRARDIPPDHVVVELSGVADPDRVTPWGQSAGFMLDGVVVIVAADQLTDPRLADGARAAIEGPVPTADIIVLTKMDLLPPERQALARERIATLAPTTAVLDPAAAGGASVGSLLNLGGRRPEGVAATANPTLFDAHVITTVPMPAGLTRDELDDELDRILANVDGIVVRAKGVVAAADDELLLVQIVGNRREITELPMAEWQPRTDLTVITLAS